MKRAEIERLAEQSQQTLDKARRYREAAEPLPDGNIDKERLLAAATAIEITGRDWTRVALELATSR